MLTALFRSVRVPDVRRKLAFTLGLLVLFRIGSRIPAPGVSYSAVRQCVETTADSGLYGVVNLFTGGALLQLALFALGAVPYITASIILQLLTVVVPRLEVLKKEGQSGRAKITQYTRYLTVALSTLQAGGILLLARGVPSRLFPNCSVAVFPDQGVFAATLFVMALVAGAVATMWIGELITERGVGNGISLLIFASIAVSLPSQTLALYQERGPVFTGLVVAAALVLIVLVVYVEQAQRRIPVSYATRTAGQTLRGGATTYLPLKVNQAGVIPVIFASSMLTLPTIIAGFLDPGSGFAQFVNTYLSTGSHPLYMTGYLIMILFFTFFYVSITFDPVEQADNLRSSGGFIPGIRPGAATASYLDYVLTRLTVVGALYLALVASLPMFALSFSGGVASQAALGGTSLLILVGVALETVKQLEGQLVTRKRTGFLSR